MAKCAEANNLFFSVSQTNYSLTFESVGGVLKPWVPGNKKPYGCTWNRSIFHGEKHDKRRCIWWGNFIILQLHKSFAFYCPSYKRGFSRCSYFNWFNYQHYHWRIIGIAKMKSRVQANDKPRLSRSEFVAWEPLLRAYPKLFKQARPIKMENSHFESPILLVPTFIR